MPPSWFLYLIKITYSMLQLEASFCWEKKSQGGCRIDYVILMRITLPWILQLNPFPSRCLNSTLTFPKCLFHQSYGHGKYKQKTFQLAGSIHLCKVYLLKKFNIIFLLQFMIITFNKHVQTNKASHFSRLSQTDATKVRSSGQWSWEWRWRFKF